MNLMDKVNQLIRKYENSKRADQYEPSWILSPFDDVYKFKKHGFDHLRSIYGEHLTEDELLKEFDMYVVGSLLTPDGTTINSFPFPPRIIHDSYKVGTTSWVYMGRKDSPIVELPHYYNGVCYAIRRQIPADIKSKLNVIHPELDDYVYAAYSLDENINLDVGPCLTFEELKDAACGEGKATIKIMKL